jgi:hypothetical protein
MVLLLAGGATVLEVKCTVAVSMALPQASAEQFSAVGLHGQCLFTMSLESRKQIPAHTFPSGLQSC